MQEGRRQGFVRLSDYKVPRAGKTRHEFMGDGQFTPKAKGINMDLKHFLDEKGVSYTVLPHSWTHGAADVATAVHTLPRHVSKTVLLHANHSYCDGVALVHADARLDFARVSRMIGGAAIRLATEEDVAVGCPDCEHGVLPALRSHEGLLPLVE